MFNHCLCCCCPYYYYCSMQYTLGYKSHLKNTRREVNYMYRQNQFTVDELAQYDGSAGKPAYVAVSGIVYDVSVQSTWGGRYPLWSLCRQGSNSSFSSMPR